jgi:O-antigen ligase
MPHELLSLCGCLLILIGLFVSRAMMSIGMMTLVGNAFLNANLVNHFKSFFSKPHLYLLSGYVLLLGSSFFWSQDIHFFNERILIALPFLLLPFAFHSMKPFSKQWFDALLLFFITLCFLGMTWSLFQYIQHKEAFDAGYGFSQVIPTPCKNDHIRFSLAIVLAICFSVQLIATSNKKILNTILIFFTLFAISYLHILSAKTGLLAFYMVSLLFIGKLIRQKSTRKKGLLIVPFLFTLPIIMYMGSTTFRNKIAYVNYSISQIKNANKETNISDEGRLISYSYALDCIKAHPWFGIGLGDIRQEMKTHYQQDFGNTSVTVLLPHNQFLMLGMAIGLPGIMYLLLMQFSLFRFVYRRDFLCVLFLCIMFLAMMVEPLYETQYGTCMFLFFLLLLLQQRTMTE